MGAGPFFLRNAQNLLLRPAGFWDNIRTKPTACSIEYATVN
jgi:hypothetical protein